MQKTIEHKEAYEINLKRRRQTLNRDQMFGGSGGMTPAELIKAKSLMRFQENEDQKYKYMSPKEKLSESRNLEYDDFSSNFD